MLYRFRYSKYEGLEYDDFVRLAKANGYVADIPRTELLIMPEVATDEITTPGQLALYEMIGSDISDSKAVELLEEYDNQPCVECFEVA